MAFASDLLNSILDFCAGVGDTTSLGSSSLSLRDDEVGKALEMKFSVEETCFRRFAAGCLNRSIRVLDEGDVIPFFKKKVKTVRSSKQRGNGTQNHPTH